MGLPIHERVLRMARRHPDRIAVIEADTMHDRGVPLAGEGRNGLRESRCWTYGELVDHALTISAALPKQSTDGRNPLVAIVGQKTGWSIAAILGTLCAGFGYVPIVGLETGEAIDAALDCARPEAIVATALPPSLRHALAEAVYVPGGILDLEGDLPPGAFFRAPRLTLGHPHEPCSPSPESIAYVVFTSGSTGKPKGAAVSHRAAVAAIDMFEAHIRPGAHDRVGGQVALGFDVSVFDIFATLGNGGTLILLTLDEGDSDADEVFHRFCTALERYQVTSLFTVPSVAREMLRGAGSAMAARSIERLILTGEPLDKLLADELLAFLPGSATLWNLYGASEFPYVLARHVQSGDPLPPSAFDRLGRGVALALEPIRSDCAHPANRSRSGAAYTCAETEISPGAQSNASLPTELVVGGPAVFSGYLESGKLVGSPGPEGVRTADLATRDENGAIRLLGRTDRTVKILGYRVDLDAIEERLESHPGVVDAAVIPSRGNDGVVAFVVARAVDPSELRSALDRHCRGVFSPWICPEGYRFLDVLPRTSSGKKDRKLLAETIA
jgi:acyl-coenzyme A synthetase/AMP-(fatty) acid ligase